MKSKDFFRISISLLRWSIEITIEHFFKYLHHRLRKPPWSLAQIPRCTLILTDVHWGAFTPRSQHTDRQNKKEMQTRPRFLLPLSCDVSCPRYSWWLRHAQNNTPTFLKIRSKCHSTRSILRDIIHVLVAFSRSDLEELLGHNLTGESRSTSRSVKAKCAGRTLLWRCWVRAFTLLFFFISRRRRRSEETSR